MRKTLAVLLTALSTTVAACATHSTGVPIATTDVGTIERGVTRKAQIRERFGEPALVQLHEDGTSTWGYVYDAEVLPLPGGWTLCRLPIVNTVFYTLGGCDRTRRVDELIVDFRADDVVAEIDFYHGEEPIDVRPGVVLSPHWPVRLPAQAPVAEAAPPTDLAASRLDTARSVSEPRTPSPSSD